MEEEMITITLKEYEELKADQQKLYALEAAGVDNWEWYDEALKDLRNDSE